MSVGLLLLYISCGGIRQQSHTGYTVVNVIRIHDASTLNINNYTSSDESRAWTKETCCSAGIVSWGRGGAGIQTKKYHDIIYNTTYKRQVRYGSTVLANVNICQHVHLYPPPWLHKQKTRHMCLYINPKCTFITSSDSPALDDQPDNPYSVIACVKGAISRQKLGRRNRNSLRVNCTNMTQRGRTS